VDDCSTENTAKIVNQFEDVRIKYIKLDKNSGANKARNIGIKNAKYNLIVFNDSDNI
jgi:teichuronic acid biosynthesis glycosyltransferase TuaG